MDVPPVQLEGPAIELHATAVQGLAHHYHSHAHGLPLAFKLVRSCFLV
jgi:hypothetical protein